MAWSSERRGEKEDRGRENEGSRVGDFGLLLIGHLGLFSNKIINDIFIGINKMITDKELNI